MFKVLTTTGISEEYARWIDALDAAKARIPECKGWFSEIRILEDGEPVWSFTRSNKYPVFLGPGTYNRLARQFIRETLAEEQVAQAQNPPEDNPEGDEAQRS